MRVLVACEYSGRVRDAFRALGHDAWSCDILPSEADPAFHIEAPVQSVLHLGWDLMIGHPPCTFMANSANKHLYIDMKKENGRNEERWKSMAEARWFRRLEKCIREMPKSAEVTVRAGGQILIHERGATRRYFDKHGDTDNVPHLDSFNATHIVGEESSI
jgi:hypothetical protein